MANRFVDDVRRLPFLLLTAALVAAPARGQGADESEPPVPADLLVSDWRLGPFYVKPLFALTDVGFDTNVLNTTTATKDFTFVLAPGVRLALPVGEGAFSLTQNVSYSYFRDLEDRRGWNAATAIVGDFLLGSISVKVSETFRKTDEYLSDELLARPRRVDQLFEATVSTDHESGFYLEASLAHHLLRFDRDETFEESGQSLSNQLDRMDYRGGLAGFLDALPGARLIIGGATDRYDFRFGDSDRDTRGYFVFSGLRFDDESAVSGDVRIGYERLEVGGFAHPEFAGLAAQGTLRFDLGGASWFELEGNRSNGYSDFSLNRFAQSSGGGFTLGFGLGDSFELEINPRVAKFRYPLTEAEALGGKLEGTYDLKRLHIRGSLPIVGDMRLQLGLLFREVDGVDRAYDGVAVTTGLIYGR